METEIDGRKRYICDRCSRLIEGNFAWDDVVICSACERHLCRRCRVNDPRDSSDYPDHYCDECWKEGKEFRDKQEQLRDMIDTLERQWKSHCEMKRKWPITPG